MKLVDLSITEFAKSLVQMLQLQVVVLLLPYPLQMGFPLQKWSVNWPFGKKKYAEFEDHIKAVHEKSAQLQDQLLEAIDKDTEAFKLYQLSLIFQKKRKKRKLLVVKPCKKLWNMRQYLLSLWWSSSLRLLKPPKKLLASPTPMRLVT